MIQKEMISSEMSRSENQQIILLAAVAKNRVIGADNDLPWHLPEDLKRFKTLTTGHTLVMGRKTFDSIVRRLGKPLPNRHSLVLSRDGAWRPEPSVLAAGSSVGAQVSVVHSVDDIIAMAVPLLYVIGGAEIYQLMIDRATALEITEIDLEIPGDAFFPNIDLKVWRCSTSELALSSASSLQYRFVRYDRHREA